MVNPNLCPVCGYSMEEPARDYNICPSCGTEFGLHDRNATVEELRSAWLKTGPSWWSQTDLEPTNWNPYLQLADLLLGQSKLRMFYEQPEITIGAVQSSTTADVPEKAAA